MDKPRLHARRNSVTDGKERSASSAKPATNQVNRGKILAMYSNGKSWFAAAAVAVSCLVGASEANAGGTSAPGFTSGLPIYAIFPEGLTFLNQTQTSFRDIDGTDVRLNSDILFFFYQSPWTLAGGALSFIFAPTLADVSIEGGPHSSGFYNTYGAAQISWEIADGLYAGYRFGGYIGQDNEVSLRYDTIEQRAGLTYLKDGWSGLANFMYGTPTGGKGSKFAPDYFVGDFSLTKSFGKWAIGPVGHVAYDLNTPFSGYQKQKSAALGGLISYDFGGATLQVKLTHDVMQKNYGGKETTLWTNLIVPIGSLMSPATPAVTK